ncbi:hypothetical protein [Shewanella insulae]|uniref:hypothetical protein n=1 Tax=Shewanella insulae TaxID=2681496 RepID=UPI002481490D|nr:hypothetical protein [Shewanella insulae]
MDKQQVVMIVMLVLVVATSLSELYKYRLRQERRRTAPGNRDEMARLRQENQRLAERVSVLERIVTDGDYQLKQEFAELNRGA